MGIPIKHRKLNTYIDFFILLYVKLFFRINYYRRDVVVIDSPYPRYTTFIFYGG